MHKSFFAAYFLSLLIFVFSTDISQIVFGNLDDAIPSAYGDFNSDELTDVFVLRDDFKTLEILLADQSDVGLLHTSNLRCHYSSLKITSVVPGDFDGDAFMDVMFTVKLDDRKVGVYINYGGSDHLNCTSNDTEPIITMRGEPMALDFNDDMIIDLFGIDELGERHFWVFGKERKEPSKVRRLRR